jgi:hypothetical protein
MPKWIEKLADLKEFIARNSEIKIDERNWKIPSYLERDFYRLFDGIREDFVEDFCSELILIDRSIDRHR